MAHRGASICSHTTSQKIFDVRARIYSHLFALHNGYHDIYLQSGTEASRDFRGIIPEPPRVRPRYVTAIKPRLARWLAQCEVSCERSIRFFSMQKSSYFTAQNYLK